MCWPCGGVPGTCEWTVVSAKGDNIRMWSFVVMYNNVMYILYMGKTVHSYILFYISFSPPPNQSPSPLSLLSSSPPPSPPPHLPSLSILPPSLPPPPLFFQEVDGESLLSLDPQMMVKLMDLKTGPALRIHRNITSLKKDFNITD